MYHFSFALEQRKGEVTSRSCSCHLYLVLHGFSACVTLELAVKPRGTISLTKGGGCHWSLKDGLDRESAASCVGWTLNLAFYFIFMGGANPAVVRVYSWQCAQGSLLVGIRGSYWCQGSNPGPPLAKQAPYLPHMQISHTILIYPRE